MKITCGACGHEREVPEAKLPPAFYIKPNGPVIVGACSDWTVIEDQHHDETIERQMLAMGYRRYTLSADRKGEG